MKGLFFDDDYDEENSQQKDVNHNFELTEIITKPGLSPDVVMAEMGTSIREQRELLPPPPDEEDESFIMGAGVADFDHEVVKPNFNGQHEETMFDDDITSALLNGIDESNQFHNIS